jgi:hypothetical protein
MIVWFFCFASFNLQRVGQSVGLKGEKYVINGLTHDQRYHEL